MENITFALIGGTGAFKKGEYPESLIVETKYGEAVIEIIQIENKKVALLKRHGAKHNVAPHKINYKANIAALKKIGVQKILATAAVGSINKKFKPGSLILLTDYLDFTWGRGNTFFEESDEKVVHVDMTDPYCKNFRKEIYCASKKADIFVYDKGAVYVCTQGPRFETKAEISMYSKLGGDLVGMTSVPEVVLAREAEICYAAIAVVTNYAAGVSERELTHAEVIDKMNESSQELEKVFKEVVKNIEMSGNCACRSAVSSQVDLGG